MTGNEARKSDCAIDIMIVDDSMEHVAALRQQIRSLSHKDYSIRGSCSAPHAVRQCIEDPPDCLLLAMRMPELDGLAFLERLRSDGSVAFPVVMMTNYGDEGVAAHAMRLGAQDYLIKERTTPELLRRAIEYARERFIITQALAISNSWLTEANAALRDNMERLRAIFSQGSVGIAQTDLEGRFTLANHAFCVLAGVSKEHLLKSRLQDVWEDCVEIPAEGNAESDKQYRRPDQSRLWVHETISAIHDEQGKTVERVILARDITARKSAEEAQSMLASLVEASADAMICQDLDGIIRVWNHGAECTYGYSARDVMGKPFTILVPADKLAEYEEMQRKAADGQPVRGFETVRIHRDGYRFPAAVTFSAIRDNTGRVAGFSSIARDIPQ